MLMEKTFESNLGKFLIRPYCKEDEQGVLSLWHAAFNKELSPDIWRWKYLKNPYKQNILVCTDEEGTILAMFGGIPYKANWEGKPIEILHAMDIMSHPDYRGAGLFVRTCRAFIDFYCSPGGACFLFGFPGKYHYDLGEKFLGYRELKGGLRFLTVRTADLAHGKKKLGGSLQQITEIGSSFDHLWNNCVEKYPLSIVRDAPFLGWRFIDNPLHEYDIRVYRRWPKRRISGYVVLSREGKKARIVDMLAPHSSGWISDFLAQIGLELLKSEIEEVETWLPTDHFLCDAAISAGFRALPEPLGIVLTVRPFDHSPPFGWMARNLYFTMGDGDLL